MVSFRVPDWLAVFVGGVVGTAARAGLDEVAKASPVHGLFLSWSTLTVNVVGAFLLGALSAWVAGCLARGVGDPVSLKTLKLLVGTGFAGAFTTYGTYIVASVGYVSLNGIAEAVAQSLGLLALGGACAWVGMRVGEWLCGPSAVSADCVTSVNDEGERA
ncbi:CrcB family protein [Actinomyces bouchesdurhonensis]|nr:CrcB family protein [Actinomyces bouchesdurhonensis]